MKAPVKMPPGEFLRSIFMEAVAAVHPDRVIPGSLPDPPGGRVIVLGAGKASAAMAAAVEHAWPHARIEGLIVTRYGHSAPCRHVRVVEADHPVPDAASIAAARDMLQRATAAGPDDLVLCLMSGGGSALMALPEAGVSLSDKQELARQLLASGAPIRDINRIRMAVSAIKGGKLAFAAHPAKVHTIVISDIPGDDPALVASGPSIPSRVTLEEIESIMDRWKIQPLEAIRRHLSNYQPPQVDIPHHKRSVTVAATARTMLNAALHAATSAGIAAKIADDNMEGEAREVAGTMAAEVRLRQAILPPGSSLLLLSGGETSVTKTGNGHGGRNCEFLLALCIALEGVKSYHGIACDTDGIDGSEDNAGAVVDATTLDRARDMGLDPATFLSNNDSYSFFEALGDLVVTGPTLTNVNDFRAILIQ